MTFFKMSRTLILSIVFSSLLFAAHEPSAFGSTSSYMQENKELRDKLLNLENSLQELKESQEGLKSLIQGQSRKLQLLSNRDTANQKEEKGKAYTSEELNNILEENNKGIRANFALHDENFKNLQESVQALGELINKLNQEFRADIQSIRSELSQLSNKKDDKNRSSLPKNPQDTKSPSPKKIKHNFSKENASNIYKEAIGFFEQKNFTEAKERFEWAVANRYKPASSNYLLGEIAFKQKRYKDAIFYYKESATLFDKASYMPRLLLHSAKSLTHIGDKENAKRFLETLLTSYPKTPEGKEAKTLLKH